MRILALNAYHGGSHREFLSGWQKNSGHTFTNFTLPPYKWKWRMRHAAVTFSEMLEQQREPPPEWDLLFCTDMLNLAEFRGLAPRSVCGTPAVVYFHENQLTYPDRAREERDLHFAFTNLTTALAANQIWFNSAYHRDEFLTALESWMRRMPDHTPRDLTASIRSKSAVLPPGIESPPPRGERRPGPLRILWVSRWEHDKDPVTFFQALNLLQDSGVAFRLSLLGESFGRVPHCFAEAKQRLGSRIDHWGYVESRAAYWSVLAESDVVVSTAEHEFFGIGVLESVAAGCFPLVPFRLAYPEVLGNHSLFFHDGTPTVIANRLENMSRQIEKGADLWDVDSRDRVSVERHDWRVVARRMDAAASEVAAKRHPVPSCPSS